MHRRKRQAFKTILFETTPSNGVTSHTSGSGEKIKESLSYPQPITRLIEVTAPQIGHGLFMGTQLHTSQSSHVAQLQAYELFIIYADDKVIKIYTHRYQIASILHFDSFLHSSRCKTNRIPYRFNSNKDHNLFPQLQRLHFNA